MLIPGPIGSVLRFALFLFFIVLIGRLILDWVQAFARDWRPRGPMLVVAEVVYTITDPPLSALRKVIPPLTARAAPPRPRLPGPDVRDHRADVHHLAAWPSPNRTGVDPLGWRANRGSGMLDLHLLMPANEVTT